MKDVIRSFLKSLAPLSPIALIVGGIVVITALAWFVWIEVRRAKEPMESTLKGGRLSWAWLLPLGVLVIAAAILRLWGLDGKTLTHPEIYIPGIPLPAGISEPPPRLDFLTAIRWHYFYEPHPLGFYLAMFGWTKLFGVSAVSLRLPSALAGILSIPVVFCIGAITYDRTVGLIAAAFLAFHGFHIYTSQQARMFVPECFLGLLATWLLVEILRTRRFQGLLEAGYVAVMVAGFLTEWFFWPLAGAHVLFTLLHYRDKTGRIARLLYVQILSIVLGAHTLSHAFTTLWQAGSGLKPSLLALSQFLSFGIWYWPNIFSREWPSPFPDWVTAGALILSIGLLVRGCRVRPRVTCILDSARMPALAPLTLGAAGMTVLMSGLALLSLDYITYLAPISVFPLVAVAVLPAAAVIGPALGSCLPSTKERTAFVAAVTSPVLILGLIAPLMVFLAAFFRPMVDRQALLVFVPYLLILLAAGTRELIRIELVAAPLVVALASLFVASTWYFHILPSSPRDYAGIGRLISARLKPEDVVFVLPRKWYVTPVFYYLDASRLVAHDYAASAGQWPQERVWVVLFERESRTKEMSAALHDFDLKDQVTALGARGLLYERH